MLILIPILITILAIIYIVSPIDFLPEIVLGPIGLADDVVAILIAIGVWLIYFAVPILKLFIYFIIGTGILIGLIYLLVLLYKKIIPKKRRKK